MNPSCNYQCEQNLYCKKEAKPADVLVLHHMQQPPSHQFGMKTSLLLHESEVT
jgi:hypothetical protein